MRCRKLIFGLLLIALFGPNGTSQQNHSLFFMHYLPESNLLNPAIPITCKWYVGIPALSSIHMNYGNSSFTYNQLFSSSGSGTYEADINKVVNQLHWRNFIGSEFHTQLFALGYRRGEYSFMFTITEKNNTPVFYPREAIMLLWGGNTQFEGETASLRGTGVYFNHYREYALSVSKLTKEGILIGGRAKLLFGKLNISPSLMNIALQTDETTFNLDFSGDLKVRTSLPIIVENDGNSIGNIQYNDAVNPMSLALNRKNPGGAIDLGIIYPYSDKIQLSVSLIDLGVIRWGSNLNTFNGSGEFQYTGFIGDSLNSETYFDNLLNAFSDSMQLNATPDKYWTVLPPRIIAGGTYKLRDDLKAGVQGEAIFHRSKIIPSATISAHYEPFDALQVMASYTVQYYSLKNFGFGIVVGRNPLQFYAISDNLIGNIWPLTTRNLNLRFGLNINLGCREKQKESVPGGKGMLQGNCYWLEKSIQKEKKKQDARGKNQVKKRKDSRQ